MWTRGHLRVPWGMLGPKPYRFLETEEGLDVAWERKILIFLQDNVHFYDSTSGRGQKCANALQTKNIDFLAGKRTFLQTE